MAYQSIYRKFRPKTFDELLGQEHVTTVLKNQIINGNVGHAYLFCGTRGTGKTSASKLFARAVNCLNNIDGNPCNECEVCNGILDDSIMDVIEMDAASNNSVEDIRDLREKAKYPPAKGKYKVYIVDEVHMLSKGAFNALLKTLEEPPKHLLFILATTEPQKLPATIQSRCQRYDFKRISVNDMLINMKNICEELGVKVEEKGLYLIAKNADGAMRDAQSLLDQCVSFTGSEITYDDVISVLGTVNSTTIFEIADGIIEKSIKNSLQIVENVVQNGKDINQFMKDLILHFRNLMIVKSADNVDNIIDGSKEFIEELKKQSKKISLPEIIRCLQILSEGENQSKWSSQPRIVLEISIIKLCNNATDLSIESMSHRLVKLENIIKSGKTIIEDNKLTDNQDNEEKKNIDYNLPDNSIKSNESSSVESQEPLKSGNNNETEFQGTNDNVSNQEVVKNWAEVLKVIKKERISIHALIMEGKPVDIKGNTLIISFDEGFGFHRDAIDKNQNKEYVQGVINNFFKSNLEIKFIMDNEVSELQSNEKKNSEVVDKVKGVFGEDLVEVQ